MRHFLYITYLHIRPIVFKGFVEKKYSEPGRHKGVDDDDDDDRGLILQVGLCLDSDVPPYRILSSVHVSGTSPELSLLRFLTHEFRCAMEQGQVNGSLVQMFLSLRSLPLQPITVLISS